MMRSFAITAAAVAVWGATLLAGCNGGAGPATPFDPFGSEPSGSVSEPPGSSSDMPPSGGQGGTGSIAQQCQAVCARIAAACPSYASTDCVSGCSGSATEYPNCVSELEAFLTCLASAQITCSSGSLDAPGCESQTLAFANCESSGGAGGTSVTGAGGAAP